MKRNTIISNLLTKISLLAIVGVVCTLTSCREDFDYNEAYLANPEYAYKQNFEAAYGKIDPNQSWDFTTKGGITLTRAEGELQMTTTQVPADAANQCVDNLPEGVDNRSVGHGYTLMSQGTFVVCPIWHGDCGNYNLVVHGFHPVTKVEVTYKLTALQIQTGMAYKNGVTPNKKIGKSDTKNGPGGWILEIPDGYVIELYLEMLDAQKNPISQDTAPTSSLMLDHSNTIYGHRHEYSDFIIFNDSNSDNDYNDLVVAVYTRAGDTPPIIIDDTTTKESLSIIPKRYMVEDLGATDQTDIDFNDIVVDFEDITSVILTFTNGVLTNISEASRYQRATIKALGGTKDITLKVGTPSSSTTIFTKSNATASPSVINGDYSQDEIEHGLEVAHMYNTGIPVVEDGDLSGISYDNELNSTDYIAKALIPNNVWDPATNNVFVEVAEIGTSDGITPNSSVKNITFPTPGSVPFMIAVDIEQLWNREKCSVLETQKIQGMSDPSTAGYNLLLTQ